MIVDPSHDPDLLAHLGATHVRDVRDEDGTLMGYDVLPDDLDLSGYASAVLPARVRTATGYALLSALSKDKRAALREKASPDDVERFRMRGADLIPEDNPVIGRLSEVVGLKPKTWFDRALAG